ncbi:MAG: VWA domain-containing protein [Treponema sp.]|nr:VWA domain-containing protein [Treponema sp.]
MYSLFGLWLSGPLFPGGDAQDTRASSRPSRTSDLSEVIPPQEIRIAEYISKGTYAYPVQEAGPIQVFLAADLRDTTGYLQVGLRATHDLPPLNIAFVIDKSRSMEEQGRMDWVKEALRGFMEQVRPADVVSLVIFDAAAKTLIPPTQMKSPQDKQRFLAQVRSLKSSGRSDIYQGMALGYTLVAANYRKGYSNRLICLTDGEHNAGNKDRKDILRLVETYHTQGITLSTVALGESADFTLMADSARTGGGQARFITDPQDLAETFGRKLDRLIMPAARMLKMDLHLAQGVRLQETWGYEHRVLGTTVQYTLGSLYNEDTKTLAAEVQVDPRLLSKQMDIPLGTGYVEYRDQDDVLCRQGPYPIVLRASAISNRAELQHPWIQESEGFIHLGRGLIHLGNLAQEIHTLQRRYESLKRYEAPPPESHRTFSEDNNGLIPVTETPEGSLAQVQNRLLQALEEALQAIEGIARYLQGIQAALGEEKYEAELGLLTRYHGAFSRLYTRYRADG